MLRAIRSSTKWIFYILAIAFVGWLVFDVGMGVTGGGQYGGADIVLKVNGQAVHVPQYQTALQAAYEQYRRQAGAGSLTRDDEKQIQDQVVDQLVQNLLLQQEYRRLGITVSDQEVIEAARSSPPPEVMQLPEFQTDAQFDITKYQRFLASGSDPQFLQALDARYREQIPQVKLAQYLTADVYVSDGKLWRVYRDQHDSVSVALLAIRPEMAADADAPVSDAELERYYAAHHDDLKRPAVAYTSFTAVDRRPDGEDSTAALARARRLREELVRGATFADVAKRESSDSGSGQRGGDLGWFQRDEPGFDARFLAAVRQLRPGQLSPPVLSSFGYHLIRLEAATGDSVRARHILIPIALQGAHEDQVEARADTLDRLAAEQTEGSVLDSAARQLGLPLAPAPSLIEGDRMTLGGGRDVIPDVSVWAFESRVGETSPMIDAPSGYYVFRLDSLTPAGVPPLGDVREVVLAAVRVEKKRELARRRAEELAGPLRGYPSLAAAGAARGLPVQTLGLFTRLNPPGPLRQEPRAVGAAFGLRTSERSGLIVGQSGFFFVEPLTRKLADSTAWLAQRDAQRESLLAPARQARVQAYLAALRARAKIVDRRKEVYRTPAQVAGS